MNKNRLKESIGEADKFIEKLNETIKEKDIKNMDMFKVALILWDAWKLSGHKNPEGTLYYLHGDAKSYIFNAFSGEIQKNLDKSPNTVIGSKVKEYFGDYTDIDYRRLQVLKRLKGFGQ